MSSNKKKHSLPVLILTKEYYITGRANLIFCAVGLGLIPI